MRLAALLLALGSLSGCTGRTEIVVGVVTDLKARGQIDKVEFQALRNGVPVINHPWDLADLPANQYELPGSFGIYSPDGSEVQVELVVKGSIANAPVVERRSLVRLVSGQTLFMRMGLVGDCGTMDGPTCSSGESCIEGVCRPEELNAHRLPPFRPELVDHVDCQSGTGFVVSSTGLPMPSDGTDCAGDEYCEEGVCLKRLPEDPPASASQPEWVDTSNPSPLPLRALSGAEDSGDVYAVGEGGVVVHGVGADDPAWTPEDPGLLPVTGGVAKPNLFGVFVAAGGEVFACGSAGTLLHKKGGVWSLEPLPADVRVDRLDAIWGVSADDLWAVGRAPGNLPLILHRFGGKWLVDASATGTAGLRAVFGLAADDIWAVGGDSNVLHFDGASWTKVDVEPGHEFLGIGGTKELGLFVVGRKGLVARLTTGGITLEKPPLESDLFAIWSGGKTLYAVGDYGKILVSLGDGKWAEQVSGTQAALFAVFGLRGHIFAAGRLGKILRSLGATPGAPDMGEPPDMTVPECTSDGECSTICTGSTLHVRGCDTGKCVEKSTNACAGGYQCAADGVACRQSCGADADCQDAFYCDSTAVCKPRLTQGTACDDVAQCKTAGCRQCAGGFFCTDHVCCDKSPAQCGGCMQCTAPTGTCDPVPAGEDPRGTCTGMTAECTQTKCNGRGTCNNTGNFCGTNACMSGMLTTHACADGTCTANPAITCAASSPCLDATTCAGKCADDNGCPAGTYCDQNGDCAAQKNQGGSCNTTTHCKTPGCRECSATQCVDGFCCDKACGGQCEACDLVNKQGTCSQVPSGQPHGARTKCTTNVAACAGFCASSPTSCDYPTGACGTDSCSGTSKTTHTCSLGACSVPHVNMCSTGYLCNAGGTDCNVSCAGDGDCASGYYCDKAGTCQPQKANGGSCNLGTGTGGHCKTANCRECTSGSCTDGVCCDVACGGQCQACDVVSHVGTCYPVVGAPHGGRAACTGSVSDPMCNGSCAGVVGNAGSQTACSYPTVACGTNSCSGSSLTTHTCGGGTCSNSSTGACATGYVCASSTTCGGPTCTSDAQCDVANDYYCNKSSSTCVKSHTAGGACSVASDCKAGTCHLCAGANQCAFGVCCESACSGQCQMCNASGKCVTAGAGQPVQGRAACDPGVANCGARCDGTNTTCQYAPASTVCAGPSCVTDHTSEIAYCTGDGKCNTPSDTVCGSQGEYACVGAGSCNSSCGGDADCASTPFQWACNTVVQSPGYCAFPLGHGCRLGKDCGSNFCAPDANQKLLCCNEPCTVGSSGLTCMNYNPKTGQFTAEGRGAACGGGVCKATTITCDTKLQRPGFTCDPAVGQCSTSCQCSGPPDANNLCDSAQCDRANGFRCQRDKQACQKG